MKDFVFVHTFFNQFLLLVCTFFHWWKSNWNICMCEGLILFSYMQSSSISSFCLFSLTVSKVLANLLLGPTTKLETTLVLSAFLASVPCLAALNSSKVPKFFWAAANFFALNCSMAFL